MPFRSTVTNPTSSVRAAAAQRGKKLHNLWWIWSRKNNEYLILPSDAALCHVALLEGDSQVERFELEAPSYSTQVAGVTIGTRFDATVFFRDGTSAWDEVKAVENAKEVEDSDQIKAQRLLSAQHHKTYRLFTKEDFLPKLDRVWNLLRILQCVAAAKDFPLAAHKTFILAKLGGGPATLRDLELVGDKDVGLLLAATFDLFLDGHVSIDIDSHAIDNFSLVTLGGSVND